jgi:hypothetical protein
MFKRLFLMLMLMALASIPARSTQAQAFVTWLIYADEAGSVWHYDSSTGIATPLIEADGNEYYNTITLSPDHEHVMVYRTNSNTLFTLYIFQISDGALVLERNLLPDDFVESSDMGAQGRELPTELMLNEPAWSPQGDQLVWAEGVSGGDATLAFWNAATNEVTVVQEDEPGYPFDWAWSPTGDRVVYYAIDTAGTGAGYNVNGTYQVFPIEAVAAPLPMAQPTPDFVRGYTLIGWNTPNSFIFSWVDMYAGGGGLFEFNVMTNETHELLPITEVMGAPMGWDEQTQTVVFRVPDPTPGTLAAGTYTLNVNGGTPVAVENIQLEPYELEVRTLGSGFVQFGYTSTLYNISTGSVIDLQGQDLGNARVALSGSNALYGTAEGTVLTNLTSGERQILSSGQYLAGQWVFEDQYYLVLIREGETNTLYQGDLTGTLTPIQTGVSTDFVGFLPG